MSKCALLVGINYIGTSNQLYGCINDVIMMRKYLIEKRGYKDSDITVLREDIKSFKSPTKVNILSELSSLIKKANESNANEIFFHYSGHGTYANDNNNDEADKRDEFICPIDLKCIRDDDLKEIVSNLNNNTNMYTIMDCCHSGTNMDLPFLYNQVGGKMRLIENNYSKYKTLLRKKIFSLSGCRDDQTSADAYNVYNEMSNSDTRYEISNKNKAGGALTSCLLNILNKNTTLDFTSILPKLQNDLKKSYYSQVPLLSSTVVLTKSNTKPKPKPKNNLKDEKKFKKINKEQNTTKYILNNINIANNTNIENNINNTNNAKKNKSGRKKLNKNYLKLNKIIMMNIK